MEEYNLSVVVETIVMHGVCGGHALEKVLPQFMRQPCPPN